MKKTSTRSRFGDNQVKYRTVIVDDLASSDYAFGSLASNIRQNEFLRELAQQPDVLNCGPNRFAKFTMRHNGLRWQVEAESDAEEDD